MNTKYDASIRILEIEKAIRNIQKDGLKVGLKDGKLYVENTSVGLLKTIEEPDIYGYAEIDCFAK